MILAFAPCERRGGLQILIGIVWCFLVFTNPLAGFSCERICCIKADIGNILEGL